MSLTEAIAQILPLLLSKTTKRIDTETDGYKISAYLVVDMVRVDIKPK